jgi:serine/threonine-protein kinase SRPK3
LEKHLTDNIRGEDSYVVQLLDAFMHAGPNGNHYIMVFEILGCNLLEVIKRYDYKGVPLHLVRILARQCLMGLDYLHRTCNLIHTDLKPENVILNLDKAELKEIYERGYLTTTNVYNLPEKIKNLLSFNVYDPRKP